MLFKLKKQFLILILEAPIAILKKFLLICELLEMKSVFLPFICVVFLIVVVVVVLVVVVVDADVELCVGDWCHQNNDHHRVENQSKTGKSWSSEIQTKTLVKLTLEIAITT